MGKVLFIQASGRGERSKSITVGKAFLDAYKSRHPDDEVVTLDLFDADLPSFDGDAINAKYAIMHGEKFSPQQEQVWLQIVRIIVDFKSADKYVLSAGMWNFSIPYRLKQYVDLLVQPGYTFSYSDQSGYQGLVRSKPLLAIYARGGEYSPGSDAEAFDMQKKYIELIFGFMGFDNIRSIIVEPTLQGGPEIAAQKLTEAIEKARAMAAEF